jgi:L-seryl-tRNA(Ser) seleniumtransferase
VDQGQASRLRDLPSVQQLASALDAPHPLAVAAARAAIDAARAALLEGDEQDVDVLADARARLTARERASLRGVINATGVIVHTTPGRAPLPAAARDAVTAAASGYANL